MTASCVAITAARLASIASSQLVKKRSGSSATPSRDNNSYTTIFRTPYTSDWSRGNVAPIIHECEGRGANGLFAPPDARRDGAPAVTAPARSEYGGFPF